MRSLFTLGFLLFLPAFSAQSAVKFIEMKDHQELESLPPQLLATFEIACNETFVKLIRQETLDEDTGKVIIAIGGLVDVSSDSSCTWQSVPEAISVDAGTTFSGRDFEVTTILSGN